MNALKAIQDAALLKMAEADLLAEAKRARLRHATAGPSGWQPVPKTNKPFLVNTLLQNMARNRIIANKQGKCEKSQRKFLREDKNIVKNNFIYQKPKGDKKLKKKKEDSKKHNSEPIAKKTHEPKTKKKVRQIKKIKVIYFSVPRN